MRPLNIETTTHGYVGMVHRPPRPPRPPRPCAEIVESQITKFVMTCCDKFTCHEKHLICFYNFDFVHKNVLEPFKYNVHICVITMMYMFVNFICIKYIKHASIND